MPAKHTFSVEGWEYFGRLWIKVGGEAHDRRVPGRSHRAGGLRSKMLM